jgi:hypothetical protein
MNIIDVIEIWWTSVSPLLEERGVSGQFRRSPADRSKRSCHLNLRRNESEFDLVVWESGEAELMAVGDVGAVQMRHFDDVRRPPELASLLTRPATRW